MILRRALAPALLVLIVVVFFWKLTLTNQYTWLASPDLAQMVLPWFQFQTREWHHLRFPLWDPYSWAGQPFLAQAQPGAAYPLNWILFLLPFDKGWMSWTAMNWYYVLTRALAALTCYWLCRDLERSRPAALVAGVTYGIAGYMASVEWPQMVNGAVWAPLVFLFQFRAAGCARPVRNAILSGFFLGLAWLAGHHQMPLFLTMGSAFLWLYLVLRGRRFDRRLAWCAAAAVVVAVLVSALQTLPTAEYGRLARRWASDGEPLRWNETVPYRIHAQYSIKPISLLSVAIPGFDQNVNPFIGIAALTFALIGLLRGWRHPPVRYLAALGLGGVIFALGPNSIFHGILYAVIPVIEKARVPAQALLLFSVAASALVAFGLDELAALSRKAVHRAAAVLFGIAALLGGAGAYLVLSRQLALDGDTRFLITALAATLTAGVILAANRRLIALAVAPLLLALVLFENGNVSGYKWAGIDNKERMTDLRRLSEDHDIRMFLESQPGFPRISYDMEAIPNNIGAWWGIETFEAYIAGAPALLWERDPFNPRTRSLLGERFYVGTKPLYPDQTVVFQGQSGRRVYQFASWMPRVWAVHQAAQVSAGDAVRMLVDPSIDLAAGTFSTLPPPRLDQCSGDTVALKRHMANSASIEARMACRGLVILNDQFFPGWKATVDGRPAPIIDAYGFLRGVPVDAGVHTVEFKYRPASVFAGAALSVLGALIAATAALRRT
jgi:hypothetical protein